MPIYTSCFARARLIPPQLRAVSIARWPPRGWKGERHLPLAPPAALLREIKSGVIDWPAYVERYNAHLATLEPATVARALGEGAVLLCFCPPGFPCHRRLAAEFLEAALGIPVPELGFAREVIPPAAASPHPDDPIDELPWQARCDHCHQAQRVRLPEAEHRCVRCGRRFALRWD